MFFSLKERPFYAAYSSAPTFLQPRVWIPITLFMLFFSLYYWNCNEKRTKINKKEAWIGPFLKKNQTSFEVWLKICASNVSSFALVTFWKQKVKSNILGIFWLFEFSEARDFLFLVKRNWLLKWIRIFGTICLIGSTMKIRQRGPDPWSSGYGRLWVWISALYTGWTFFT